MPDADVASEAASGTQSLERAVTLLREVEGRTRRGSQHR